MSGILTHLSPLRDEVKIQQLGLCTSKFFLQASELLTEWYPNQIPANDKVVAGPQAFCGAMGMLR